MLKRRIQSITICLGCIQILLGQGRRNDRGVRRCGAYSFKQDIRIVKGDFKELRRLCILGIAWSISRRIGNTSIQEENITKYSVNICHE